MLERTRNELNKKELKVLGLRVLKALCEKWEVSVGEEASLREMYQKYGAVYNPLLLSSTVCSEWANGLKSTIIHAGGSALVGGGAPLPKLNAEHRIVLACNQIIGDNVPSLETIEELERYL